MDPNAIAKAIPGVDSFEPVEGEDHAWQATIKIALATVKGGYGGTVKMQDFVVPEQYRLVVNGEGQQSIIGGTVLISLADEDDHTLITWDAEANISGKLARVGQRVIKAAATMMSNRFFQGLEDQLQDNPST
jgi:carbon monoxide dehydrogenase subunit G